MIGKMKRLRRICNSSGRTIIVPMDHGFTLGRIDGIKDIGASIDRLIQNDIDAVVLHKGIVMKHFDSLQKSDLGILLHISGSTNLGDSNNHKMLVSSVDDAIMLGCDGVSIHVNLGGEHESEMIRDFGIVSSECYKKGMPLLAMVYSKNKEKNHIGHTIQIACEMGADLVKVGFEGDFEAFYEAVENADIPVLVAGGERFSKEEELFEMLCTLFRNTTISGISMGRNIFQSNHVDELLQVVKEIVYKKATLKESINLYNLLLNPKMELAVSAGGNKFV